MDRETPHHFGPNLPPKIDKQRIYDWGTKIFTRSTTITQLKLTNTHAQTKRSKNSNQNT